MVNVVSGVKAARAVRDGVPIVREVKSPIKQDLAPYRYSEKAVRGTSTG